MRGREGQKVTDGDPIPGALYQPILGSVDRGYGQGDTSPEKLNGHPHLDMASLPSLDCAGPLQDWVQVSPRLCPLLLTELQRTVLHKIFSSQTGTWVSQVTSSSTLGSAYLYQKISTIITFVCTKQLSILISIYTTAIWP